MDDAQTAKIKDLELKLNHATSKLVENQIEKASSTVRRSSQQTRRRSPAGAAEGPLSFVYSEDDSSSDDYEDAGKRGIYLALLIDCVIGLFY